MSVNGVGRKRGRGQSSSVNSFPSTSDRSSSSATSTSDSPPSTPQRSQTRGGPVRFLLNGSEVRAKLPVVDVQSIFGLGVLLMDVSNINSQRDKPSRSGVIDDDVMDLTARRGVLLLPDPVTRLVTVEHGHSYALVRFHGRHLFSAGVLVPDAEPLPQAVDALLATSVDGGTHAALAARSGTWRMLTGFRQFQQTCAGRGMDINAASRAWTAMSETERAKFVQPGPL